MNIDWYVDRVFISIPISGIPNFRRSPGPQACSCCGEIRMIPNVKLFCSKYDITFPSMTAGWRICDSYKGVYYEVFI